MLRYALFLAVGLTACTSPKPDFRRAGAALRPDLRAAAASFERLPGVLARCRGASHVEVFEGLPHPTGTPGEVRAYARESRRGDTFANHGFRFYSPAMSLSKFRRTRILCEVVRTSSYEAWGGMKFCGDFHPDLLVRFHCPTGVIDLHLCFGCFEAKFFEGATLVHVDIRDGTAEKLERIQQASRTKRPKSDADECSLAPARRGEELENAIDALLSPVPGGGAGVHQRGGAR
jgi:hypothetical protein